MRSVIMPAGRRHIEPLRIAAARIQEYCSSLRCSSARMGFCRMPNIIQTANITVNAVVDQVRTRLAPTGWLSWDVVVGASVAGVLTTCSLLQALIGSGCMAEKLLVQSPRDARLRPCEALRGGSHQQVWHSLRI